MDSQAILARTSQGAEALATQDYDLPRKLRHALILVDGRSTVAKLEQRGAIIPDFPAALRELVARGLVAPIGHGGPPTTPGDAAAARSLVNALVAMAESILGDKAGKVAVRRGTGSCLFPRFSFRFRFIRAGNAFRWAGIVRWGFFLVTVIAVWRSAVIRSISGLPCFQSLGSGVDNPYFHSASAFFGEVYHRL